MEEKSTEKQNLITTLNASELMAMKLPQPKWAVDRIIPEGHTILAGNPKFGKSWMALNLAVAIASGGVALGNTPVEAGDVHYLALEDNLRRLQSRLTKFLQGNPAPERLMFSTQWPRLNEGGFEQLDEWLESHPAARLVIVDTFSKVRPIRRGNSNIYNDDYHDISLLKDLADKYSVAVVAIHHTRKSAMNEDQLETVTGSYGISAAADSVLILKRERGQHDGTLFVVGRDVTEREIALRWDTSTGHWTALEGEAADYRLSPERATAIRILREQNRPIAPKEMAGLTGNTEPATRKLLSNMAKDGQIKSTGDGKYVLNSHSSNSNHTINEESMNSEHEAVTPVTSVSESNNESSNGFDEWF